MAKVDIKSIRELFKERFVIQTYQRGYRWSNTQIRELLEDLSDYNADKPDNNDENDYYCLQPIIVKQTTDNQWELVDGQQRLTAMWLINALYFCFQKYLYSDIEFETYSLYYHNKPVFTKIFEDIERFVCDGKKSIANDLDTFVNENRRKSVDCNHLMNSMEQIAAFKYGKDAAGVVLQNIYNMIEHDKVKVLWYQLDENEKVIETFTNINANKIELTNSELIKAVLLNIFKKKKSEKLEEQKSLQWEAIERKLNNDDYWDFIAGDTEYATRIDYLFEIWCHKEGIKLDEDRYSLFRAIDDYLKLEKNKELEKASCIWEDIQTINETLEDWYNDYYYYHTIGLLIALAKNKPLLIKDIYKDYSKETKKTFRQQLRDRITDYFVGKGKEFPFKLLEKVDIENDLNEISYENTSTETIKEILLLYNIALLVNANNFYERFPFSLYYGEEWDVEHINPRMPGKPTEEEMKEWVLSYQCLLDEDINNELKKKIDSFVQGKEINLESLIADIKEKLGIEDVENFCNLTLLDQSTNRSYKNNAFIAKRRRIIAVERNLESFNNQKNEIKYIPIGTRWVFLKGFEGSKQLLVWSDSDMKDYLKDVSKQIFDMLKGVKDAG